MFAGSIVRLRAPLVVDAYSGAATRRDWTAATSVTLYGFAVAPGGPGEAVGDNGTREAVTSTPSLYGPHGADVAHSDRITFEGRTYDVTSHRADWANPWTGQTFGAAWSLLLVDG